LEILINCQDIKIPKNTNPTKIDGESAEVKIKVNHETNQAEVFLPSDFLFKFQQPENLGEKFVVRAFADSLLQMHKANEIEINCDLEELVQKILGDVGMRVLHLFETYYPIEYLLMSQNTKISTIAHDDFVFSKLNLSIKNTSFEPGSKIIGKGDCNKFLHKIVDKIWNDLKLLLSQFNRTSIIKKASIVHEAIIRDRAHWRRTAKAILSLHSSSKDVYSVVQERDKERNNVAIASRTLIEMAICESPSKSGKEISKWELDELLAKIVLFIEVAMDSDAINLELMEPEIEIHMNGEYTVERNFYQTVIFPFLSNYMQEEFDGAASAYSKLYNLKKPSEPKNADSMYSKSFIKAFTEEFKLTPDEAIDGFAELMEVAVESQNVVVEKPLGYLRQRLIRNRNLTKETCEAFFKTFGLFHRKEWLTPPNGSTKHDIYPWRFRRKLSAVVKPLFIFGGDDVNKVIYGAGGFKDGLAYLFDRIEQGQLPGRFFNTEIMKSYIGAINNEKGHLFANTIGNKLVSDGWLVRKEVNMSELKAPTEYGDIDVLAWKESGEILLIECKRLQFAKTIAEIAEICRRFRGEDRDELDKHIQRVKWIKENPSSLRDIVGFTPNSVQIDHRLVTNTHVPMMYISSLPIEPEKIGPI
jgi:hypothetical protein